jgi:hypothetical protein
VLGDSLVAEQGGRALPLSKVNSTLDPREPYDLRALPHRALVTDNGLARTPSCAISHDRDMNVAISARRSETPPQMI